MTTNCASVQSLAGSADGADGTPPDSLSQIYFSRPGTSLTAAASGPGGLVIRRVTSAGIRRVHDRYITSPRQVHDRLNQIQSLRGDTGNPCGMTPPLAQRPDPRAVSLATAPCQSSTRRRAARTRSPPPWQPRWDGAGRSGSLPRPRVRTRPARRPSRAERRRTGRPGCTACTSQASSPGARVTGQNGHGSAKQAVPRTAPSARTLSAYLHRRSDASGSAVAAFTVCGRASLCSLALIAAGSCERAAGSGGAKRPRSGAEGALDPAARERIMAGGGKGANLRRDRRFRDCLRGAFLAGIGVTCSMTGRGRRGGQPGLPRPAGASPRPGHDDRLGCPPACGGMRPLSLYRPSAWPCAAGPGAADSGLAGAGRGYAPSGEFGSGSPDWPAASGWAAMGRDGGLRRQ